MGAAFVAGLLIGAIVASAIIMIATRR